MAKTEPAPIPPNFRRKWLDGQWVPAKTLKVSFGYTDETDWKHDSPKTSAYKIYGEVGGAIESVLEAERIYIEKIEREYSPEGGDYRGRLDSFGFALATAFKSTKEAGKGLETGFLKLDKKEKEIKMAKKADTKTSPFRKGRATGVRGKGGQFMRLAEGESVVFAPMVGLDEMISADMHEYWDLKPAIYHPCIGLNCPGCLVENDARFKAYLPILVKSTGEPSIYPFTISVYNQLEALEDTIMEDDKSATLKGFVVKASRKGAGKATRYNILGVGSRIDLTDAEIPDFIPQLGPDNESAIWELLEKNGYDRADYGATSAADAPAGPEDHEATPDDWGAV